MLDHFTYDDYINLLKSIREQHDNLCFVDVREFEPQRYFLLRHDIDFSPDAALTMAQLEAKHGIRATYFLLLTSDCYNLMAESCCDFPRRLIDLGHEVGLHYDVRAMAKRANDDLKRQLEMEIDVLTSLAGEPVRSISMHNPSVYGDDPFATLTCYVNAYDKRWTRAISYYSDSCGAWRNSAYEAFDSLQFPDRFQLLIHPFFWGEKPGNRWERLEAWTMEINETVEGRVLGIRKNWRNHAGLREHEDRVSKRKT